MSAEGAALLCCLSIDVPRLRRSICNSFDFSRPDGRAYALPALWASLKLVASVICPSTTQSIQRKFGDSHPFSPRWGGVVNPCARNSTARHPCASRLSHLRSRVWPYSRRGGRSAGSPPIRPTDLFDPAEPPSPQFSLRARPGQARSSSHASFISGLGGRNAPS